MLTLLCLLCLCGRSLLLSHRLLMLLIHSLRSNVMRLIMELSDKLVTVSLAVAGDLRLRVNFCHRNLREKLLILERHIGLRLRLNLLHLAVMLPGLRLLLHVQLLEFNLKHLHLLVSLSNGCLRLWRKRAVVVLQLRRKHLVEPIGQLLW